MTFIYLATVLPSENISDNIFEIGINSGREGILINVLINKEMLMKIAKRNFMPDENDRT